MNLRLVVVIGITACMSPEACDLGAGGADAPDGKADGTTTGSYGVLYEKFNALNTGTPTKWPMDDRGHPEYVGGRSASPCLRTTRASSPAKPSGTGRVSLTTGLPNSVAGSPSRRRSSPLTRRLQGDPVHLRSSPVLRVASVSFLDGTIRAHVGGVATTVQPFIANAWYRVRVVVDTDKGVFDLYVDGVRKLTPSNSAPPPARSPR